MKILKFETKVTLIGHFGLKFQKTNVVFEITILEFIYIQSFIQKQKTLNLGPKKPDLGIFVLQFNKSYYQILNQNLWIREIMEFHPKQNKNKLGTKNALFRSLGWDVEKVFWYLKSMPSNLPSLKFSRKNSNAKIRDQRCLIWVFLDWHLQYILSYLISASSNLSCCKVWCKIKNP